MEELYDAEVTPDTEEANVSDENIGTTDEGHEEGSAEAEKADEPTVDYEALIAEDIASLKAEFPELSELNSITELNNPLRYAALRDLGLTAAEAYMATAKRRAPDNRAHLKSAHGRSAAAPVGMMSQLELATARDLFPGRSDAELQRLYKRVTK